MDSSALHDLAYAAAKAGSEAILAISTEHLNTKDKAGVEDFVTAADLASEHAIISAIKRLRPDDQILAEETGLHGGTSGIRWYVDPLDGTANIVAGSPDFAVCVSAHLNDETLAAVVYRPTDDLWLATTPERQLRGTITPRLASRWPLTSTKITVSRPHDPARRDEAMALREFLLPHVGSEHRVGSAACALLRVITGDLDVYVSVDLPAWDTAAGHHLVELAGGKVTTVNSQLRAPVMVAGTPRVVDAIASLVAQQL